MIRTPKPPAPRRPACNADYIPNACPQCGVTVLRTRAELEQDRVVHPLTWPTCRQCRGMVVSGELELVSA